MPVHGVFEDRANDLLFFVTILRHDLFLEPSGGNFNGTLSGVRRTCGEQNNGKDKNTSIRLKQMTSNLPVLI
jgi:hypothetical protein